MLNGKGRWLLLGSHPLAGRVVTVDSAERLKELGYVLSHQYGDMFGRLC
ncbi:Unannotated [Lentimonas sp. CC4]|nr:Unannotated [Lentimonas sp. CC4]CAA6685517.1 Unannotated [Lentimonas sp. CC6]CAA7076965.1 Unannotated [Lentimonas sp. CC4]CAA7170516.1 Unannotated [Lentimonas sp. CC21]CAA7179787.1 Unannotated [Lentimonas sp. CC8]